MTEAQIKQNAEAWVKPLIGAEKGGYNENSVSISLMKNTFLAGAHSRDEEIDKLKELLTLRKQLYGAAIKELDRLRSPWISVKDSLPEEPFSVGSNRSKEVYVRTAKGCNYIASYNFIRKDWIIVKDGYVQLTNDNVIKWMPIPQIEKGE